MSNNKRRVRFLENDTIAEVESRGDYTNQEILDSFYDENELTKITFRSYEEAIKSTGFLRGLERFTDPGHAANKQRHMNAVMDEQDFQWAMEEDDHDRLAVVSQEMSKFSVTLALQRAEQDEQEAQRIYELMQKVSEAIEEDEDTTSICSDLSHPDFG